MRTETNNKLVRDREFKDFDEARNFMSQVASLAQEHNHHPYWTNVYNRVHIELTTHDAGDIVTDKDWELAKAIDEIDLS
jgi:4a-hydroxytetrahydrobiopterin dehydratase